MKSIKKKLSSNSGASMLLALVFLMFCLFIGGSVLSAATANGSRAARQIEDQQAYFSQRSASLLLADMLKGDKNSGMQLTVKEVTGGGKTTITFTAHGENASSQNKLQTMLYQLAIKEYLKPLDVESYTAQYVNVSAPESSLLDSGTITLELAGTSGKIDDLTANYDASDGELFAVDYAIPAATVNGVEIPAQKSYFKMTMKCYKAKGDPVTVNGIRTTTTVIRWDEPVIEKGGA